MGNLRYDIGHQLIIRDSQIEHPAGGRGVYMILSKQKQKIEIGDLIGFVPGKVYARY
jgi:hypothetical protein